MRLDHYDLPVSTPSLPALESYDRAVDALIAWKESATGLFQRAIALDPDLAVAHAGLAVCLLHDDLGAEAVAASEAARAAAITAKVTPRERVYVNAIGLFVTGQWLECERVIREHLKTYPRDLLIAWRLYEMLFWEGRPADMLALTTSLMESYPADSYLLGLHAFAVEENGRCGEAARLAEAALARNAEDPWAVHALAHALFESGSFHAGALRLPPAILACTGMNWFSHHLRWHEALMHFARGDYDTAREVSHRYMEQRPSAYTNDLHDSTSMLWRFDLVGQSAGERWTPFAAIARERVKGMNMPFTEPHLALALAATKDTAAAEVQLGRLKVQAQSDESKLFGEVVIPLIEGLHAFAEGDYPRVIAKIEPIRSRIIGIGGSHAQRDVFTDTLFEAAFRAGDTERCGRFLGERIARRPDYHWVARAV
jgi:tetratricopeptide (TPR) repeat protein